MSDRNPEATDYGPAGGRIIQLAIRPDLIVAIQGIPHDLTPTEAQRIANIVQNFAQKKDV